MSVFKDIFTKKLEVPESNEMREIDVAQLWEVRWLSRHGQYSGDVRPEVEVFLTKIEAMDFKLSLTNAFSLIRHTSGNYVEINRVK